MEFRIVGVMRSPKPLFLSRLTQLQSMVSSFHTNLSAFTSFMLESQGFHTVHDVIRVDLMSSKWVVEIPNRLRITNSNTRAPSLAFPKPSQSLSIRYVRVGRVDIPNNKRVEYSLQYIHGIGRNKAKQILFNLGIDNKVTKELQDEELFRLREEVSKYTIEGDLRRFNALNIRRLEEIQCYRGIRHILRLPCRGQRTKNNCRFFKGKRVAVARTGKKKAPGKKKARGK